MLVEKQNYINTSNSRQTHNQCLHLICKSEIENRLSESIVVGEMVKKLEIAEDFIILRHVLKHDMKVNSYL